MQHEQGSITRPLDDITLYPIEPDAVLAEEVRRTVGHDYRIGVKLWFGAIILALFVEFVLDKPNLRTIVTVGVPVAWFLICVQSLKSLDKADAKRILKAGAWSIRDCVSIRAPQDHVVRYRYSGMRGCTIMMNGLEIVMSDGRILDMPARVFANPYEMKAFAKALAEQKNVPVIDLTEREAAGVS